MLRHVVRMGARLAVATATIGAVLMAAPAAQADPECDWVAGDDGVLVCVDPGTPGGPGDDGGNDGGDDIVEPQCDLSGSLYNDYCDGDARCFRNDPAALQEPEDNGLDPSEKPDPDAHAIYWECERPDGTTYERYFWSGAEPTPPPLGERARRAIARIPLPDFTPTFNPPGRTFVSLDTWWWAAGATRRAISGEALGVVAVARPDHMEVDPGDSTGAKRCPFRVRRSDACVHAYAKSSLGGTFTARMRLVYTLEFRLGNQVRDIPGAPSQLETEWANQTIPVRESQAIVAPH
ncbi:MULTISPECIES: hypothetical protein [Mumia]|uniref:hypothetical protein n=1 Tax=Mumia TaxID=1546255 RepID=UPI001423B3A4|nr:hypothetical protein [Mumia sp. ZJ430]